MLPSIIFLQQLLDYLSVKFLKETFSPNDKCVKVVPSGGNDAWEFDDAETKN